MSRYSIKVSQTVRSYLIIQVDADNESKAQTKALNTARTLQHEFCDSDEPRFRVEAISTSD